MCGSVWQSCCVLLDIRKPKAEFFTGIVPNDNSLGEKLDWFAEL